MVNIYGEYLWRIFMVNIYGEYLWRIFMENIYGENNIIDIFSI